MKKRFVGRSEVDWQRGSIEAGLTLLPTTAFFLLILQLVISGGFQVMETINLQNFVTRKAIGENIEYQPVFGAKGELSAKTAALPGGGELILTKSDIATPKITALLSLAPNMKTQAIAISE
jgi:hypothetical protein